MTPKLKKIIIGILVIAVLFTVWAIFFKSDPEVDSLISGSSGSVSGRSLGDAQVLGAQITQALIQIESLELDETVFDNAIFRSLVDRSQLIEKEPIGRRNPFAPLSDTSVNFNSSVSSIDFGTSTEEIEDQPEDEFATTTPEALETSDEILQ
jgi:hypothetical protein